MKHITILLVLIIFCTFLSKAQNESFYIPKEFQKAIKQGTRTTIGKPGANYWQNSADYKITAEFEPATKTLTGSEVITYTNNSPDELKYFVVRLYQNLFKKGVMRQVEVEAEDVHEGVEIGTIIVNGDTVPTDKVSIQGTSMYFGTKEPIASNSKTTIEIEWKFTLPHETKIRMGTYGESSFFIAQWYPQISVYDDLAGWDMHEFTGPQEFYNNYGDFDVEITIPKDYIIWATGENTNIAEVLSKETIDKINTAKQNPGEVINVVSEEDIKAQNITKQNENNTWKFNAKNVPDFAFGLSKEYLWDVVAVEIEDRIVQINSAYGIENHTSDSVAYVAYQSMKYFSEDLPGIAFPYPNYSVFEGNFGMEFPMMSNQGDMETYNEMVYVTSHEMLHSYFPFLVGTNERLHAWIDEGLAIFLPADLQVSLDSTKDQAAYNTKVFSMFSGREDEPTLITPSKYLYGNWYFINSYAKGYQMFYLLYKELGASLFKECLLEFIERWEGKHPTPYDMLNTFNDATSKNFNWFFKKWIFEPGVPDLAIENVQLVGNQLNYDIVRTGDFPVPILTTLEFSDGTKTEFRKGFSVWKDGKKKYDVLTRIPEGKTPLKITLGDSRLPDNNPGNNSYEFN